MRPSLHLKGQSAMRSHSINHQIITDSRSAAHADQRKPRSWIIFTAVLMNWRYWDRMKSNSLLLCSLPQVKQSCSLCGRRQATATGATHSLPQKSILYYYSPGTASRNHLATCSSASTRSLKSRGTGSAPCVPGVPQAFWTGASICRGNRLASSGAGMAANCVSRSCCSYAVSSSDRGRQAVRRTAFCGERVAASLKAQTTWLRAAPTRLPRRSASGVLQVSAVLADLDESLDVDAEEKERVDPRTVLSIILGGGAGTRLYPLTKRRAKPAVPIGGAYRLIDVPMSNCINSGINKVFILTQFNSTSLNRHLARTYNFGKINFGDGFVEVLAATQTPSGTEWFQGTADAVRQYLWLFEDAKNKVVEDVVILSGDHLYRMDYLDFVQKHRDSGADITISCVPMDDSRASDYGLMKIDDEGRVLYFNEKPKGAELKTMQVDTKVLGLTSEEAKAKPYIASMGIYVFKKEVLLKLLRWRYPTSNDFGSEIIPAAAKEFNVQAYLFNDYWEDIGTIKSFFDANLALTAQPPQFSFYDATKPIFTSPRYLPPTKIEQCQVKDSIISHGCFLRSCSVEHSIVGIRSRLESGAVLKDTMMMGADFYETEEEIAQMLKEGKIPVGVGANSRISNCIIDKNARIGKNVVIANTDNVQEAMRPEEGFYIKTGVTVIEKNGVIKDGTVI